MPAPFAQLGRRLEGMLSLPRSSKGLSSDQKATFVALKVLSVLIPVAIVWAFSDQHPIRRTAALLLTGALAITYVVAAIGLAMDLQREREEQEQWERDRELSKRLDRLESQISDLRSSTRFSGGV